jgi:predicted transposase/invertase (TIGR01784 family)
MNTSTLTALTDAEIRQLAKQNAADGKLLNPMMDIVFKTLFSGSDDDSCQALRSLLSACTGREVTDVKVLNSEIQPEHLEAKTVRIDMHVSFNDGQIAGMEMQFGSGNDDQKSRAAFGAARLLSGQGRGKKYRELKRVYQIFFVNGILFPVNDRVPRRYFLMEEQDHDILTGVLEIIFYELPKLEAKVRAYGEGTKALQGFSEEEKWCIYLKYRHEAQAADLIAELCRKETGIMSVETVLKRVSRDEEQWAKQLFREKAAMDYRSGMGAARDEGIAIGDARGFERARLEYEVKLAKAERARMEIARKMKAKGWPLPEIAEDTGLSPEIIAKL